MRDGENKIGELLVIVMVSVLFGLPVGSSLSAHAHSGTPKDSVLVETEQFDDYGGWSLNTEFMGQLGPEKKFYKLVWFMAVPQAGVCFNKPMRAKREKIKEFQLVGFRYFNPLSSLLRSLYKAGFQG